ncbi:MAG: efflux RND transporter permease subunit [Phycisphaeraceae bacterium]|nr:MAG: efflux RND transporter permease subunit [Phycisphaeraceae bacterium]
MSLASFGVRNPVVANLVMFSVMGAGVIFGLRLVREFFPEVRPNMVVINAPYPGAAPDEVEDSLTVKIEDKVADLSDIDEINSIVGEGGTSITIEFDDGVDIDEKVAEVKREIDALQDLPDAADRIVVDKIEPNLPAISLSIYGDSDEKDLKRSAREIRDDLRSLPGMGDIAMGGVRTDQINVEVRPAALLEHGLSLSAVSDRIREAMLELPGGSVRTPTSNVSLRSMGVDDRAEAIRGIVVRAADGRAVRLEEIAEISDGFADTPLISRLNGKPMANLTVFKKGKEDIVRIAEMVKAYRQGRVGEPFKLNIVEKIAKMLRPPKSEAPLSARHRAYLLGQSKSGEALPGELVTTTDLARFVVGRMDLLIRNAFWGGLLVFATLVLLLNRRVSLWVAAGLVVSMLGTLAVMKFSGITLNLLSMFGLIIVVGILVDDAIVVAENITSRHEEGTPALEASIVGTKQVAWPVVATVLTTIFAFLPLAMIEGRIGDMLGVLPVIVGCALSVSLLESLFILPCHMGHSLKHTDRIHAAHKETIVQKLDDRLDRYRDALFTKGIAPAYVAVLRVLLRARYTTTLSAAALIVVSLGLVAGGRLEFIFFETDDAETVSIELQLPVGSSLAQTNELTHRIEAAVKDQPEVKSFYTIVGAVESMSGDGSGAAGTNRAQLILELVAIEQRDRTSEQIIQSIRDETGELSGIKSLRMAGVSGGPEGAAISFTLTGDTSQETLDAAASDLMAMMADFEGVQNVASDSDAGQREVRFTLREGARELGFTRANLGRQIQGMVFGLEAYTFAGNREDVDVRVMLPEPVRRSLAAIEDQFVFTPDGRPVPLSEVASIEEARSYATIRRLDRKRSVTVTADVDRTLVMADGSHPNADKIAVALESRFPEIEKKYADVSIVARGRQKDFADSFRTLPIGFLVASGLIYVTLAWLFKSYTQPLLVMTAIPFATIGMIWGHMLLGYTMTFLSLIGFVALSGIVVNDSLIFVEFFNEQRREGRSVYDACLNAGRARVRAILLTTITTVLGLLPLMLEQSFQARFLIPMAITIAFGLMSSTMIVLIVLPCLLMILQDVKRIAHRLWTGEAMPAGEVFIDPAAEVPPVTMG